MCLEILVNHRSIFCPFRITEGKRIDRNQRARLYESSAEYKDKEGREMGVKKSCKTLRRYPIQQNTDSSASTLKADSA